MLSALHLIIAAGHTAVVLNVLDTRPHPQRSRKKGKKTQTNHLTFHLRREISHFVNATGAKSKEIYTDVLHN